MLLKFLNGSFALIAVGAQAYANGGAQLGPLFKQGAALTAASAIMYQVSVNPLYKKFIARVKKEEELEAKAEAFDAEHADETTLDEVAQEPPTEPSPSDSSPFL
jgi:hypothetical protein